MEEIDETTTENTLSSDSEDLEVKPKKTKQFVFTDKRKEALKKALAAKKAKAEEKKEKKTTITEKKKTLEEKDYVALMKAFDLQEKRLDKKLRLLKMMEDDEESDDEVIEKAQKKGPKKAPSKEPINITINNEVPKSMLPAGPTMKKISASSLFF